MESIYQICFYGGLILAIILLIVSIVLFVVFRIPKVIGDLTGRSAKKEIEQKKKKGQTDTSSESSKAEQKKYYNQNTGKITIRDSATNDDIDKAPVDRKVQIPERETDILRPEDTDEDATAVLGSSNGEDETMVLGGNDEEETAVLSKGGVGDDSPTDVLTRDDIGDDSPTDVLTLDDEEETTILKTDSEKETTILTDNNISTEDKDYVYNIVIINTDESL